MRLARIIAVSFTAGFLFFILWFGQIIFDVRSTSGQDGALSGLYLPMIGSTDAGQENSFPPSPTYPVTSTPTADPKADKTATATTTGTPIIGFPTVTKTPLPAASATTTTMPRPSDTATATPRPWTTTTPAATASPISTAVGNPTRVPQVLVGPGYTDVSPKALVRTSADRLYVSVSTCDAYPCVWTSEKIRMYRADSRGIPISFKRLDSSREPGGVAQWAIAVDGNNLIHIAFNTRDIDNGPVTALKYTTFDTATDQWGAIETIDGTISFSQDSGGQGVQSIALALDAAGKPHVVYLAGTNRRIFYRNKTGTGWSNKVQVDDDVSYSGNLKAWHPNLAFDTAGRLIVAWERGSFNGANDGTIFVKIRDAASTWGSSVNVSGTNGARTTIDQSTSLLVTADNRYHIAWITAPDDYIRYHYSDDNGATWQANHPGGDSQVTHNPSLGPNGKGGIRLYGHGAPNPHPDGHGDNLYFFESNGGPAAWSAFTLYVAGAFDSSVNTRWSQYFYHFPAVVDIAYWDDAYPNILYVGSETVVP